MKEPPLLQIECDSDFKTLKISDHIEELRHIFIRCLIIIGFGTTFALIFYKEIFAFLIKPTTGNLVLLTPTEGFNTVFKLSFWIGLIGTSPIWLYTLFQFIAPALTTAQKKLVFPFVFLSFLFAAFGVFFAFLFTLPIANAFFMHFNETLGENLWSLNHYINFTLMIIFAHALSFELIVILLFLIHCRLITADAMRQKRRHACLTSLIIAAIITPPDVLTQLMVGTPLIIAYEALIVYALFLKKSPALQTNSIG